MRLYESPNISRVVVNTPSAAASGHPKHTPAAQQEHPMQSLLAAILAQAASLSPAQVKAFLSSFDVVRQNARVGLASVAPSATARA